MSSSGYTVKPNPDLFRNTSLGTAVIMVVDPVTGNVKANIDRFYSFIWTERYMECGDFELEGPIDELWAGQVQEGDYIFFSHSSSGYSSNGRGVGDYCMVVESKYTKTDAEKGKSVFLNGRSLECYLERRVNFGCRYGTMRSLKDGYLIHNPTPTQNAKYGLAITDCSYKGNLPAASGGAVPSRPDWYDHHAPLRAYELVPEITCGVNPFYFYEYLALLVVACNCGPLARTNRQFEFFSVCGIPYDASNYPEPDPMWQKSLIKGISVDIGYKEDGWYYAANKNKDNMTNDQDARYPDGYDWSSLKDEKYDETRFDWQDFANFDQPISKDWFKKNYSKEFYDSLHVVKDPYSGIGETVYDIVKMCLEKCDGRDGGWGMHLTAYTMPGQGKDWFTDPGVARNDDGDPTKSNKPHENGHIELHFELYKGRDLTLNGPHSSDGTAVVFTEQNDNIRYIDFLHGMSDYKNVVFRATGLEYVPERMWEINNELDQITRRQHFVENATNQTPWQSQSEEWNRKSTELNAEKQTIEKTMDRLGVSQQYFSAELRDRGTGIVHYPTGIERREVYSSEETKADTFIDQDQLDYSKGRVLNNEDAGLYPGTAQEQGSSGYDVSSVSGVDGNTSMAINYLGRAQTTTSAYYKREVTVKGSSGKDEKKSMWYISEFSPNWQEYAKQLKESNQNTIKLKKNSLTRDVETEVDINAFQIAGRDYRVGDRVTLAAVINGPSIYGTYQLTEDTMKTMRCDEIVYSIDGSGFTAVPTFKILDDPDPRTEMEGA